MARRLRRAPVAGLVALAALGALSSLSGGALWDLGDFIVAGRAAALGLNPYDPRPDLLGPLVGAFNLGSRNINPPISVPLCEFIAGFDPDAVRAAVFISSLLAYALAIMVLDRAHGHAVSSVRLAWAFALAGLWHTLFLGQVYAFLALAVALAWALLSRGRLTAGALLLGAVAALKPNFLVLPALLFAAGYRRAAAVTLTAFLALWGVPLALYGPGIYLQWLAALPSARETALVLNASLPGELARFGSPLGGMVASAALLLALWAWTWRQKPSLLEAAGLGLAASVLAGPAGYIETGILLLPIFLSRQHWGRSLRLSAGLMLVPFWFVWNLSLAGPLGMILAGSIHFAAFALALCAAQDVALQLRLRASLP